VRRHLALVFAGTILAAACNPSTSSPSPTPERLDDDQTLNFPIAQDIADFDPALISRPADVDVLRNLFVGLYAVDDSLHVVPEIAAAMPDVSADGKTYTVHLRPDALFSNGDPITSADVVYSWNRAAARQGDYAWAFASIAGYAAVASGASAGLSGLAAVDPATVQVTLARPAGYFVDELAMPVYWLVDRAVIQSSGEDAWTADPSTLIGAGPFRVTARVAGSSLDFAPVTGWWGGDTGALTHVHVEVLADPASVAQRFESGVYGVLGYARQAVPLDRLKEEPTLVPLGVAYWVGFNQRAGPFAGAAGKAGRHALSIAIDRAALARAVCAQAPCTPATGGLISPGLAGYLGDDHDGNAKFDAAAAKAEYAEWDANGAKVKGLAYVYDSTPFNKAVCTNLTQQWKQNLGIAVRCVELDSRTFLDGRNGACSYTLFRQGWAADYDHPQDWMDNFVSGARTGACYSNPTFDNAVKAADSRPLDVSLSDYKAAGSILVGDTAFAPLVYAVQPYLAQPYVKGAGGNALYDHSWTEIRILAH